MKRDQKGHNNLLDPMNHVPAVYEDLTHRQRLVNLEATNCNACTKNSLVAQHTFSKQYLNVPSIWVETCECLVFLEIAWKWLLYS